MPDTRTDFARKLLADDPNLSDADLAAALKVFDAQSVKPAAGRGSGYDPNAHGALANFLEEALSSVNPSKINDAVQQSFWHPIDTIKGIGQAQGALAQKTAEAYQRGDYPTMVRHAVSYLIPILGPRLDQASDYMQQGQIARGLGATTDVALQTVLPEAAARLPALRVPALVGATREPGMARAIETGRAMGVPMDAATATGNPFIQGVQKLADESLLGSLVGSRAKAAQRAGVQDMGRALQAEAHPVPVEAGAAGQTAQEALGGVVSGHRAAADEAYTRLRAIEATDATPPAVAPPIGAQPYTKNITHVTTPEGKQGILSSGFDVRRGGGLGGNDFGPGLYAADTSGDLASFWRNQIETKGETGVAQTDVLHGKADLTHALVIEDMTPLRNSGGRGAGVMVPKDRRLIVAQQMPEQLAKFDELVKSGTTPNRALGQLARESGYDGMVLERRAGDEVIVFDPSKVSWEGQTGKPSAPTAPHVPMAVDLTETKAAMQPIYDKLAAEAKLVPFVSGSGKGQAFIALDRLLNGPDTAPLSVADAALSDLKRMARANDPNLRTAGQGIAAKAVDNLHRAVSEAAERAGPEAVQALDTGRTATKAKYAAADILKQLVGREGTKEPVAAFRTIIKPGDASLGTLRDVLKQAPDTKPEIARAVLDGIIDHPTMGVQAKASAWGRLGAQTKALLYTPEHIQALDDFFLLARKMAENPNPSGSGTMVAKLLELGAASKLSPLAPAVSALLHSEAGVRLLTKGFRIPLASKAAQAAWFASVTRAIGQQQEEHP